VSGAIIAERANPKINPQAKTVHCNLMLNFLHASNKKVPTNTGNQKMQNRGSKTKYSKPQQTKETIALLFVENDLFYIMCTPQADGLSGLK